MHATLRSPLSRLILGALALSPIGAAPATQPASEDRPVEATSLLGEPLHRSELPDEFRSTQLFELARMRLELLNDPDDEMTHIWIGRRLAYLGRYRDAIDHYTRAIRQFPESHKLLRHRGHRYITTRQFDKAVEDLYKAMAMAVDLEDEIEPDGLPNEKNLPRSTTFTNITYHLGLACYLTDKRPFTPVVFGQCVEASTNDDMRVAALYWQYLALHRNDQADDAAKLLEAVTPEMDIIENDGYHRLLLLFKGELSEDDLLKNLDEGVTTPTVLYGVAQHRKLSGDDEGSRELLDRIIAGGNWAAFGYIAAEADLARLE
ncbi:MAG: tetratricopeptide repeat protein [Phycisphaerales bacterium JB059]